ncbi:MAG: hypothetical protein K6A42_09815 [Treponema sp.]|nr:hypothetical protein [Treponema sp.]
MKKLSLLAAVVIAAALFFGCSNSSDSPVAAYTGPALPANEGANPFAGNKYKYTITSVSSSGNYKEYDFKDTTVTYTHVSNKAEVENQNSAYTQIVTVNYSYSYNATTKRLYLLQTNESISYRRGDVTYSVANPNLLVFYNDAQFVAGIKTCYAGMYDKITSDEGWNNFVKSFRKRVFEAYGYTDATGATEVSTEIIQRYNEQRLRNKALIKPYCYAVDSTSLKFQDDSYLPPSISNLGQIYGSYDLSFVVKKNNAIVYNVKYNNNKYQNPSVIGADNLSGYQILSVSGNNIITSEDASRTSASGIWSYTSKLATLTGIQSTKDAAHFDVNLSYNGSEIGTVTITYASESNYDIARANDVYTKQ